MRRFELMYLEHNGILDWDAIKGGIEFAIIRSSWGHLKIKAVSKECME